jgi:hypothetical protein
MNQNRKAIVSGPTRKPGVSTGRWGSISDSSKLDMGLRIDLICNQTSGETTTSLFGAEYAGDRVRWDCRNHSGTRASHAWHSSPQPLEPINQPNRIDLYRSVKAVVPSVPAETDDSRASELGHPTYEEIQPVRWVPSVPVRTLAKRVRY